MAASDHLSAYQFGPSQHPSEGFHEVNATHNGEKVGELSWAAREGVHNDDGTPMAEHEVSHLHVEHAHRNKGVATQMWNTARSVDPEIMHSSDKTVAGAYWAKKVGGPDPWSED